MIELATWFCDWDCIWTRGASSDRTRGSIVRRIRSIGRRWQEAGGQEDLRRKLSSLCEWSSRGGASPGLELLILTTAWHHPL